MSERVTRRPAWLRTSLMVVVLAIWALALTRVLIDPTPRVPILFNVTPSLPYTVALMEPHQGTYRRGDYVVYAFAGDATRHYAGLAHQPFFKVVRGVPGDIVTVVNRHVYINGIDVGVAKPSAFDGYALAPIAPVVIPANHYYVQGLSPDSFDSRYAASGLVRADRILSKVRPIL